MGSIPISAFLIYYIRHRGEMVNTLNLGFNYIRVQVPSMLNNRNRLIGRTLVFDTKNKGSSPFFCSFLFLF